MSNLPFISKILEKVILEQLNEHKVNNDSIEKFQSAYRKYHSTETALLRISNDLLQSMDKKQCCFLVLLDLSAAFDTVNHNILINRLSDRFGVKDDALSWITSYLHNRSNFVSINGSRSSPVVQHCNVPQGSVLGPTFFSDYISPLSHIFDKWGVLFHSYADDTQIYAPFTPGVDEDIVINRAAKLASFQKSSLVRENALTDTHRVKPVFKANSRCKQASTWVLWRASIFAHINCGLILGLRDIADHFSSFL